MNDVREYVVTLKNYDDLDKFYEDMESRRGSSTIPARQVEIANRRLISRNTHYYLTDQEAEELKKDPRVLAVDVPIEQNPFVKIVPCYSQTSSNWVKSGRTTISNTHLNWGLIRCCNGHISGWGSDATQSRSGTIEVKTDGSGVDVVISDGFVTVNHPEFAVNSNGTGGSRVVQFNWLSLTPFVTGAGAGNYSYLFGSEVNNQHGTHVAGTACGNTQGWARASAIYNIYPYGNDNNSEVTGSTHFDYIRVFHTRKSSPKRPTIVNCSWAGQIGIYVLGVSSITRRGVVYNMSGASESTLRANGIPTIYDYPGDGLNPAGRVFYLGSRNAAMDADISDAIRDGIIVVGAAGNNDETLVGPSSVDYNNVVTLTNNTSYFLQRGASPACADDFVCVGAVNNTSTETKASYSSSGSRVDIYAPGESIISATNSITPPTDYPPTVLDSRNSSFAQIKIGGTSMASPQVTGVLACALQIYPRMNQSMARNYLTSYSSSLGDLNDTGSDPTSYSSAFGLRGAANRYLRSRNERADTGPVSPKRNYWLRRSENLVYPRPANVSLGRV